MNSSAFFADPTQVIRYFSPDEANRMLPLVSMIVRDIMDLANELVERKTRLDVIRSSSFQRSDVYTDELEQIEKTIDQDRLRLQELLEELCDLGIHPREPMRGIIAFPTLVDNEQTYLLWRIGEPNVTPLIDLEKELSTPGNLDLLADQSGN